MPKARLRRLTWIAAAIVSVAAMVAGVLVYRSTVVADAQAESAEDRAQSTELLEAARMAVQGRVQDAQAITFGKVFVNRIGPDPAVCGEVDIDEPDDSVGGPERFVYLGGQLTLDQLDGTDTVAAKWRDVCDG